jgi:hypothetical protein
MLATGMVSSMLAFAGSVSSPVSVPVTSANRPLTVEIMRCRTANSTWEWLGSMVQLVAAAVAVLVWATVAVVLIGVSSIEVTVCQ